MKKPVALWILPADSFPFYRLSYWRTISQRSAPKHLRRPPQQFTPFANPCASRRRCLKLKPSCIALSQSARAYCEYAFQRPASHRHRSLIEIVRDASAVRPLATPPDESHLILSSLEPSTI